MKKICIYCGANISVAAHFLNDAKKFGSLLAKNQFEIIYGGTKFGSMGALADGALAAGGIVTGVFPEEVFTKKDEELHQSLSNTILVNNMHTRKFKMFDLADAFVILPGGLGTMDETFEMITWKVLGTHSKSIIIYNYQNYYYHWLKLIDHFIENNFAKKQIKDNYVIMDNKVDIINKLKNIS